MSFSFTIFFFYLFGALRHLLSFPTRRSSDLRRISAVLGDVNLNSPVQLKEALETHTGRTLVSTDAKKVLKPLAKDFPIVADILRFKEIGKLYGTYVDKLPKALKESTGKGMCADSQQGAQNGGLGCGGST